MNNLSIPEKFKIDRLIHQKTYLVNGELKSWNGNTSAVYSTISSTVEYKPTLLGSIPLLEEKQAMEALDAASSAYNNGQGLWPTMKVADRITCMEKFVSQMKTKRDEVVKYLDFLKHNSNNTNSYTANSLKYPGCEELFIK